MSSSAEMRMGNASTVFERMMMNPPSEALQLQRDAITAFGWSIDDDRKAVESVKEILNDMLDDSDLIWKKLAENWKEQGECGEIRRYLERSGRI